jgi:hypothetical protein
MGVVGYGMSSLEMSSGGGGDGHPSMGRLDALTRFKEAAKILAEARCPRLPKGSSADLLIMVCAEDQAFSAVAGMAGVSDEVIKSWIAQILTVLANHYHKLDRTAGRETTVYTAEAALKRFEPEL